MKRLVLAIAIAALLAAAVGAAQAGQADTVHYPDLRTLTPSDIKVQRVHATGAKLLRLSNTVANLGDGRLELRPENDPATGTTQAYQRLYSHDSDGNWYLSGETLVGSFSFHVVHNHWHFEDFAVYELREVAGDGGFGDLVRSTEKVTFCIIDTELDDASLEHTTGPTYTSCGPSATQGLSVGWGDKYPWNLAGQSIDITGVPSGDYWLVSTADPENLIDEGGGARETNNTAAAKIRLRGNGVRVLP